MPGLRAPAPPPVTAGPSHSTFHPSRALKKAAQHGLPTGDPWWAVRLLHATRRDKYDRENGRVP